MYTKIEKLSLVMPAYNEGAHIYKNLLEVSKTLEELVPDYEIILVDDGSIDDTLAEAIRASKARPPVCPSGRGRPAP